MKSLGAAGTAIRAAGARGHNFVVDADIQGYFDMALMKERISDRRVLKLIRQWLEAGVMEGGTVRETLAGTPQGGVISLGIPVRYAGDFGKKASYSWEVRSARSEASYGRRASISCSDGGLRRRAGRFGTACES
jgi:retron-type reverse transcriptase